MISYLKGAVLEKGPNFLVLENQGIGYKVLVTPEGLEHKKGDEVALYTYHKVSDDGQTLFGVADFATLQFFELLITVTGVGPKMALAVLSAAKTDTLRQAIANQDSEIFTRMSGVGKKTAERIILELKNKMGAQEAGGSSGSDIYDALLALGYSAKEIRNVIPKIDPSLHAEGKLKLALQLLSK